MFPIPRIRLALISLATLLVLATGVPSGRAACDICASFQQGIVWGTASVNALTEASGIAASGRNPGVLWTHNDGSREIVYALGTNGALLASFDLDRNVDDVEDMATGPGPSAGIAYLYVADIGASNEEEDSRQEIVVLRIPEPTVDPLWAEDPVSSQFNGVESLFLTYPDGGYDAEAFMLDPISGDAVIVTKQQGVARVYRASLAQMEHNDRLTMSFVRSVSFGSVSGGDISANGGQILLRRENAAALWPRCPGESIGDALGKSAQSVPVIGPPTEPNGEAVSFLRDATGYVTISEGEDPRLYFFRSLCPVAPVFTLVPTNQSAFVGGDIAFVAGAVGTPSPTYRWRLDGQTLPGKTNAVLEVFNLTLEDEGLYEIVATNPSGMAVASATLTVRPMPDLRITEVQSSPDAGAAVPTADWWELTNFDSLPVPLAGWRFNDSDGGLGDPFVIGSNIIVAPGESIVFVEGLSPTQFRRWWGQANVPALVQIVTYSGGGFGLGAGGDEVWLWNEDVMDPDDWAAMASFGPAVDSVTFNYDPVTQQFGTLSQLGIHGVVRAASSQDVGSPGRILAPATPPHLVATSSPAAVRIAFSAQVGRHYRLEAREQLASGAWNVTGDALLATNNMMLFFEVEPSGQSRFYRVRVE